MRTREEWRRRGHLELDGTDGTLLRLVTIGGAAPTARDAHGTCWTYSTTVLGQHNTEMGLFFCKRGCICGSGWRLRSNGSYCGSMQGFGGVLNAGGGGSESASKTPLSKGEKRETEAIPMSTKQFWTGLQHCSENNTSLRFCNYFFVL